MKDPLSVTPLVFVYGTLKYGHSNWRWCLSEEEYLGPAVTADRYVMGDVGFPYIFPEYVVEGQIDDEYLKPVLGDLFRISDETTMKQLDYLEGEGSHYHRKLTQTTDGDKVWIYICLDWHRISRCYKCETTENGAWKWIA